MMMKLFKTILQIFALMYDPEENTFDNELSDDKNSKRIRATSQSSSSWGKILRRKIKPRLPHSCIGESTNFGGQSGSKNTLTRLIGVFSPTVLEQNRLGESDDMFVVDESS